MKASYELKNPNKLEATITLTATVEDFRELMKHQPEAWPCWHLRNAIKEVVDKAEATFYANSKQD